MQHTSQIFLPATFTCRASSRNRAPEHSEQTVYPRYRLRNTRTCNLYFLRSRYSKNPRTPGNFLWPSMIACCCSAFNSAHGTSTGIPAARAKRFISVAYGRYFGLVHGSIGPSSSDFERSGMTRFRSKSIVLPKPWQRGQAPNGLLNENNFGSGSAYLVPQVLHSKRCENRNWCAGSLSAEV